VEGKVLFLRLAGHNFRIQNASKRNNTHTIFSLGNAALAKVVQVWCNLFVGFDLLHHGGGKSGGANSEVCGTRDRYAAVEERGECIMILSFGEQVARD
jgi:hypothetical protein